ncbi:MAG: DUF4071 domain-containing protein [Acidobacteria bacterium]|nr:DUF4071 domain-containing protein [Acidobacteriota bacterium]
MTPSNDTRKRCFVIMGFGQKTDPSTGRTLDLDSTYDELIKPAVEQAGLECKRADEIQHSGSIDARMYEELLQADLVIADISTLNANALYELGVRHALRPRTTIVIAEQELRYPFDLNHILIESYKHSGEGILHKEVVRFKQLLAGKIQAVLSSEAVDSPVYTYVQNLRQPKRAPVVRRGRAEDLGEAAAPLPGGLALLRAARQQIRELNFGEARESLLKARDLLPGNVSVVQQLALATYRHKQPSTEEALLEARGVLQTIDPLQSRDPQTLALWGAVHRRLWLLQKDQAHLDQAILAYERGFRVRNDHRSGINAALLYNARAVLPGRTPEEAITDYHTARKIRTEVRDLCRLMVDSDDGASYWVHASLAEALVGLGDEDAGRRVIETAEPAAEPEDWMAATTEERLRELHTYLNAFNGKAHTAGAD